MNLDNIFDDHSSAASATRGIISGFLGGLAGTIVKSTVERFLEVRKIDQKAAQIKIIDDLSTKFTGAPFKAGNEALAEQMVNLPLGASVGAVYGYGKREKEDVNFLDGAVLGATTWASTHESTLPLIGLEKSPNKIPVKTQIHELFAHVLFGITTEVVRNYTNKKLREYQES